MNKKMKNNRGYIIHRNMSISVNGPQKHVKPADTSKDSVTRRRALDVAEEQRRRRDDYDELFDS